MLLLFHFAFLIVIWILNMKCKFKCISFLICLAFPLYYFYKSICIIVLLIRAMSQPMYDLGVLKVVHFLKVFTLMLFTEFRGENWRFWRLEEWRTDDRTPLKGGQQFHIFALHQWETTHHLGAIVITLQLYLDL